MGENLVKELEGLPNELLVKVLIHLSGPVLAFLVSKSFRIKEISSTNELRECWLENFAQIDFTNLLLERGEQAKLLVSTWNFEPAWARQIYTGMTLYGKVGVIEDLLKSKSSWPIAIDLVQIDRAEDLKMANNNNQSSSYGIFNRHLRWRFDYYGCRYE